MALEEKRKEAERKAETFQESPNEVGQLSFRNFRNPESNVSGDSQISQASFPHYWK